jgi:hypothetical protein
MTNYVACYMSVKSCWQPFLLTNQSRTPPPFTEFMSGLPWACLGHTGQTNCVSFPRSSLTLGPGNPSSPHTLDSPIPTATLPATQFGFCCDYHAYMMHTLQKLYILPCTNAEILDTKWVQITFIFTSFFMSLWRTNYK